MAYIQLLAAQIFTAHRVIVLSLNTVMKHRRLMNHGRNVQQNQLSLLFIVSPDTHTP